MPIKTLRPRGALDGYVSPIVGDTEFRYLTLRDQHYVYHYGEEIRRYVLAGEGGVTAIGLVKDKRLSLIGAESNRELGIDSRKGACYATLRWMGERGELLKIRGGGWTRLDTGAVAADNGPA